tara:strand:+ start:1507 stop:1737 length:231 start_codon:yes stop_codon:yes gene_type:complete
MEPMENLTPEGDYLSRVVVDVSSRTFRVYSISGEEKQIVAESMDDFLGIHQFIRDFIASGLFDEDMVVYCSPMVTS